MRKRITILAVALAALAIAVIPGSASAHGIFASWNGVPNDGVLTCDEARYISSAAVGNSHGPQNFTRCGEHINSTAWRVRVDAFSASLLCTADQDNLYFWDVRYEVGCNH